MKRRTMIAATFVFALTMGMLFAGVVSAHQPNAHQFATATEQYRGYGYWGGRWR